MNFIIKLSDKSYNKFNFKKGIPNTLKHGILYYDSNLNNIIKKKNFLIFHKNFSNIIIDNIANAYEFLKNINNVFYYFIIENDKLLISNGIYGILPIYIYENPPEYIISSDIGLIIRYASKFTINKKYLLEVNLFNYSFKNSTIYEEIKIIPANTYIVCDNTVNYKNFETSIEDYFCDKVQNHKKIIDDLVDIFISLSKDKILNNSFISFTSGFDGRTLVALAKYFNIDFQTFSFGTEKNIDTIIPREQAQTLNLDYFPIYLDNEYYYKQFLEIGKNLIIQNGASTNFLQIHWPYSANFLSNLKISNNIVSGLFGSELFRAIHLSGQFSSPALIDYFSNLENNEWINKIKNSKSLKFLNVSNFQKELTELIDELNEYKNKIIHLKPNQRFYKYVFEEIFRKFFGIQIIKPQLQYMNIITPYLDFDFIKELFKTDIAGVNNDLFTNNPIKRYKGQLFYAYLLKKVAPDLYTLNTGKGYKPSDLLSFLGKTNITLNYIRKRLKRALNINYLDNLGVISSIEFNYNFFKNLKIHTEFYNKDFMDEIFANESWKKDEFLRDKFIETLSLNHYLNTIL